VINLVLMCAVINLVLMCSVINLVLTLRGDKGCRLSIACVTTGSVTSQST